MSVYQKKYRFIDSEEGQDIRQKLQFMTVDKKYNTESSYSANSSLYPNNLIPFVEKHMQYLSVHPKLDAWMYLANLRLMTRVR
jgi:hypothetical protein